MRLDQPGQAAGFHADPDAAVKRSVDDDPRPGRFILTGSVRSDLENKVWPGTGRLMRVRMYGMTQREVIGGASLAGPSMLDKIAMRSSAAFSLPAVRPDLRDYVTLATRGGFPAALLGTPPDYIEMWVSSYLEQLLTRDAHPIVANRDQQKLQRTSGPLPRCRPGCPNTKPSSTRPASMQRQRTRTTSCLPTSTSPNKSRRGLPARQIDRGQPERRPLPTSGCGSCRTPS